MKLVLISDTHTQHRKIKDLPEGDIIIHSGDMMGSGFSFPEIEDFADWYGKLNYKYKILIAGNHDRLFDDNHMDNMIGQSFTSPFRAKDCEEVIKKHGIIYLNDSSVVIDGFKFHGSPVQPWFCDWAFNRDRGEDIDKHWQMIPIDTDVLITHGPPFGYGDLVNMRGSSNKGQRVGCEDLAMRILEVNPTLHLFGHIHEAYGVYRNGNTTHVNASVVDEYYRMKNKPVEFELEKKQ